MGDNDLFDKGGFVFRVCREALALAAEVDLLAGRRGSVEEHWGQAAQAQSHQKANGGKGLGTRIGPPPPPPPLPQGDGKNIAEMCALQA